MTVLIALDMSTISYVAGIAAVFVVGVFIIGLALSRFYRKVAPEEALVRSGGGKLTVE